ncbi:hypothetical protein Tco_0601085 [Tanacetum coccineum]
MTVPSTAEEIVMHQSMFAAIKLDLEGIEATKKDIEGHLLKRTGNWCAIDGARLDWNDMAEEEIQANMALMAFSDSENMKVLFFMRKLLSLKNDRSQRMSMGLVGLELERSYSGLEEFKQPEVNEYGPRDSSLKPTTGCDKESDNSKENTDDSLEQHTETSSVKSSLKDEVEPIPKVEKKTVIPTATKKEFVNPENQLGGQLGMQRCTGHKDLGETKGIGMVKNPIS